MATGGERDAGGIEVSEGPRLSEDSKEENRAAKVDAEQDKLDEEKENGNVNEKENTKEDKKAEVPTPLYDGDEKENTKEDKKAEIPALLYDGDEKENTKEDKKGEVPMLLYDVDEKENTKEDKKAEVPMPLYDGDEKGRIAVALSDGNEKENVTRERSDGNKNENVEENEKGEGSSTLSDGNSGVSSVKGGEDVLLSELKVYEKKALAELRSKLEQAILANKLFKEVKKDEKKKEKPPNENSSRETEEPSAIVERKEERAKESSGTTVEQKETEEEKSNPKVEQKEKQEENEPNPMADQKEQQDKEESNTKVEENEKDEDESKSKSEENAEVAKEEEKSNEGKRVGKEAKVDKDVSLWGVPLLPSKGDERTDVLLIKFLRGRDFNSDDAFEMLRNTLEWRRENNIDSIAEEDFGSDYDSVAYTLGSDCEGNPVCYNVYGLFSDEELYNRTFGTEASRDRFLRWRLQLMEKQIQKLDFRPGGISSLVQINDLKNAPGPSRRDLRLATRRAVGILQDNYPEFVAKNIFINVPLWYYAFNAILSPFLTQRTKSKFVFSRPARVTETLLKYISVEQIPVRYGGLLRENDPDFSTQDAATEVNLKAGATETIEIPAPKVGNTLMWEVTVVGWDVSYKEEFVPVDEGSYTLVVKKGKKISWQDESVRNSFTNNEPGKIALTVENGMFKKKRVFYRYKIVDGDASASS